MLRGIDNFFFHDWGLDKALETVLGRLISPEDLHFLFADKEAEDKNCRIQSNF
jgi:hypothetical protein